MIQTAILRGGILFINLWRFYDESNSRNKTTNGERVFTFDFLPDDR
jgi:hypothetical protein